MRRQSHLSIFENSPHCVKILGVDGSLLAMNANGQCGMEIDDFGAVCGEMWPSLWPEATREQVREALSAARNGSTGHFEALSPTAKPPKKWWDVVVSPMLGSNLDPQYNSVMPPTKLPRWVDGYDRIAEMALEMSGPDAGEYRMDPMP